MIRAQDLKGVIAMMPAFTTTNGGSPDAQDTVDTKTLSESVDRMIKDGANAIATMGSFGEFHTLLWEEKVKLIEATIETVRKRVPVFIGCTTFHKERRCARRSSRRKPALTVCSAACRFIIH